MKNVIFKCLTTVLSLGFIGLSNTASTECCKPHVSKRVKVEEKCYLPAGSLSMDEKRLYVNLNNTLYPISHVATDEQGVYILANELVDSGVMAYCPDGHANPPWSLVCWCGKNLY